MPDLAQPALLLVVAGVAMTLVAGPLLRATRVRDAPGATNGDDIATLALRHRIAVESLRDVEADRRAGSLDESGYVEARAAAEERAATTLADFRVAQHRGLGAVPAPGQSAASAATRRAGLAMLGGLIVLLIVGSIVPGPATLANGTIVNADLAAQQEAERARRDAIGTLEKSLAARPDASGLVRLASLYLEGGAATDLQHAAQLLLLAIRIDPGQLDAYRLVITAYIQAGDYRDASAATDAYAKQAPSSVDVLFFRGLIAYRGNGDRAGAVRWFDAFLKAAPNDTRAVMVRSLRAEAAGQLPGESPASSPAP